MKLGVSLLSILFLMPWTAGAAGAPVVSYEAGILTVQCVEAPLFEVFDQIKAATGMELILEDEIKTKRLTANIEAEPVHRAIERLLEGSGVNFVVFFDYQNIQRVDKIFIGAGGGGPARSAGPISADPSSAARRPTRRAEPADQPAEEDMVDVEEPAEPADMVPDETQSIEGMEGMEGAEGMDPGMETGGPEGANPFLPPTPSYRRSTRTPGLESSPFNQTAPPQAQPQTPAVEGENPPPAYYPFLDPLGRPIPVPGQPQPKKEDEPK